MSANDYASVWITEGPTSFVVQANSGYSGALIPVVSQGFLASNNYVLVTVAGNNEIAGTQTNAIWDVTLANTLWSVGPGLGSSGRYTVQETGYYLVTATIELSGVAYNAGQYFRTVIGVNGVVDAQNYPAAISSSMSPSMSLSLCCLMFYLSAVDTMKVAGVMSLQAGWVLSVFVCLSSHTMHGI